MWSPVIRTCGCCGKPLPLIDRVRAALELEPDAPLGRVMQLVDSSDFSMVATLVRMVTLSVERASVQESQTLNYLSRTTCSRTTSSQTRKIRVSGGG